MNVVCAVVEIFLSLCCSIYSRRWGRASAYTVASERMNFCKVSSWTLCSMTATIATITGLDKKFTTW